ncbi:unnamed protein product [Paramecium primaurelia]|uniref:Transmembrane protein n=1 Tax=Paramecium primaurelia TaxID=5886 RepID=A0A8S1JUQ5_PARPR|nr:unnamed protein product [Paramecium primaurelia]
MNFLQIIIDAKFLLGIGVGFFVASFLMLPKNENNQGNGSYSKLKLSSKSLPSTQDLKQVYLKPSERPKKLKEKDSFIRELQEKGQKSQKYDFLEEDEIRKKVKMQYHQFEPMFEETSINVQSINTSSDFESSQDLRNECITLLPNNENVVQYHEDKYFNQYDKGFDENDRDLEELANIQESPILKSNQILKQKSRFIQLRMINKILRLIFIYKQVLLFEFIILDIKFLFIQYEQGNIAIFVKVRECDYILVIFLIQVNLRNLIQNLWMKMNCMNGFIKDYYYLLLLKIFNQELWQFNSGAQRDIKLESGIPLIHQFLTTMAGQQLKKNPKMVDEIIHLVQDEEEKSKLIIQLQQTQQQQVNLQVSDSPKVLKAQTDKKDSSFFQNILTALRCWDKKQK